MIDEVRCLYNLNVAPGDNFIAYCWVILSRTTDNKRFKTTKHKVQCLHPRCSGAEAVSIKEILKIQKIKKYKVFRPVLIY